MFWVQVNWAPALCFGFRENWAPAQCFGFREIGHLPNAASVTKIRPVPSSTCAVVGSTSQSGVLYAACLAEGTCECPSAGKDCCKHLEANTIKLPFSIDFVVHRNFAI
jgi:hypothetical protein